MSLPRLLGGVTTALISLTLVLFTVGFLCHHPAIPMGMESIHSLKDKIFFLFLVDGSAILYAIISGYLFTKGKISVAFLYLFMFATVIYTAGYVYHTLPW